MRKDFNPEWKFRQPLLDRNLEEITKLDPTINEIYHLQYGWYAWREHPNSEWEYEEDTDEE